VSIWPKWFPGQPFADSQVLVIEACPPCLGRTLRIDNPEYNKPSSISPNAFRPGKPIVSRILNRELTSPLLVYNCLPNSLRESPGTLTMESVQSCLTELNVDPQGQLHWRLQVFSPSELFPTLTSFFFFCNLFYDLPISPCNQFRPRRKLPPSSSFDHSHSTRYFVHSIRLPDLHLPHGGGSNLHPISCGTSVIISRVSSFCSKLVFTQTGNPIL